MGGHLGAGPQVQGDWVLVASPEPVDYPQSDGLLLSLTILYYCHSENRARVTADGPDSAQAIWAGDGIRAKPDREAPPRAQAHGCEATLCGSRTPFPWRVRSPDRVSSYGMRLLRSPRVPSPQRSGICTSVVQGSVSLVWEATATSAG